MLLTRKEFDGLLSNGPLILDGATGTNLMLRGMPRGACIEKWVMENPYVLQDLQREYVEAGSQVILTPTFQAQPIPLERVGWGGKTEVINEVLAHISKCVDPNVLVAGDLTTLASYVNSWDDANVDLMVNQYRRQIKGLINGGIDFLFAETLMYPQEAEAIMMAAELEGIEVSVYSFAMQSAGYLYSGENGISVLESLEQYGASAVGFNCLAADDFTPSLVNMIRKKVNVPIICKPNAGAPVIDDDGVAHYSLGADRFVDILESCKAEGATILGGCCGTTPEYIRKLAMRV